MWASGKSMWWNAKESEGRRNLNVNAPTVTATSDMGRHRRLRHNETASVTDHSGTDVWGQLNPGSYMQ